MSEAVVVVEELRKEFSRDRPVVSGLSFALNRGEALGLLGPNGAGKTTVVHLLLGLTTPTSGRIAIFGLPMPQKRIRVLQRVNFASAYALLPANLTVRENLMVFARLYEVARPKEKIARLLAELEIAHLVDQVAGRLSAGEATRVSLCKALLNNPELLLLDEPTAGLDPDIADKVRRLLRRLQSERGIAVLYTSHNMRDIEAVCDRVLFLRRGRLLAEGSPVEILRNFRCDDLETLFIQLSREGSGSLPVANEGGPEELSPRLPGTGGG
ncbi:ABC transporter ATP-binding protein [Methylacidimicrobium tartarophylax]|uniref:Lipopolysaccharide export system ATP-binding protein LptB n=1 Tax=Methylacidimicrobium tartarophylax TaxID=1041768 RepID=A0A5E6MET6_9BACT|nr:ABC transporter ATP-binding protein [Methylacidimicrobium tartarophylax]VVM07745.1 Lipopolysaccharide export system ATP-binding protein LptB [Methylacidimicrobium tartarophylax]